VTSLVASLVTCSPSPIVITTMRDLESVPFDVLTFPGAACCGYREMPQTVRPARPALLSAGYHASVAFRPLPAAITIGSHVAPWCAAGTVRHPVHGDPSPRFAVLDGEDRRDVVSPSGLFSGGGNDDEGTGACDDDGTRYVRSLTVGFSLVAGDGKPVPHTGDEHGYRVAHFSGHVTVDDVRAMSGDLYAFLYGMARRSAQKGRFIGSIKANADVPLPSPTSIEDDETATDAIGVLWAMLTKASHPSPVRLLRTIARRLGQRRAQHRLRERSGLVDAPTDRALPAIDARADVATLMARVSPARRAMLGRALASAEARRSGPLPLAMSATAERMRRYRARKASQRVTVPVAPV